MASTSILIDYDSSPYAQKIHLYAAATGTKIRSCDQPAILPRPTLDKLSITYRRIPILAIGKDVFCDSSLIIDALQLQNGGKNKLEASKADKAYALFGDHLFGTALRCFPIESVDEGFMKDRGTIMPELRRRDHASQRPSAVADLRSSFHIIETQFLSSSPYINGSEISLADVNVAWAVNWLINGVLGLKEKPGFGKSDLPRIYAWLERLPKKGNTETIEQDDAVKEILGAEHAMQEPKVEEGDPTGLMTGMVVSAETVDAEPGAHPQNGKLVGLDVDTVTLQLENKLRLHFQRRGTIVKKVD